MGYTAARYANRVAMGARPLFNPSALLQLYTTIDLLFAIRRRCGPWRIRKRQYRDR